MRREAVSHTGRAESVTPALTTVRFVSHAACSGCHAAGLCGLSAYAEKAVQVPTDPYAPHAVGDEVEVVLQASMGLKAVWVAYVLPLLLLMAVILVLTALHIRDWAAGLAGLGAVALYWVGVWALRDRLRNEYVFTTKKKHER